MGPLVGIGGLHVPDKSLRALERAIDTLCADCGFPPGEAFKWSPGEELWMRTNLVEDRRRDFFNSMLALAAMSGVTATIIIEEPGYQYATPDAPNAEVDVTRLFLERVEHLLRRKGVEGVVVVDRPGGGRAAEDKFLANCLETVQSGTNYVKPERIAINVVSTPSKLVRLLQVADVIIACTLALVGGEDRHSPGVFPSIKRILDREGNRIGGIGLKIHPDGRYANLYHWLLGDTTLYKRGGGIRLPSTGRPYSAGPNDP
jgi:hypothetical protein